MKIILDDGWVGWKEEEEEVFVCDVVERRRMSNKEANWMTYTPTPKKKNFFHNLKIVIITNNKHYWISTKYSNGWQY